MSGREDSRPLYQRTTDALAAVIKDVEPGSYLPSEPKLARQLGVSRATLREAMRVFEGQGVIVRKQGVGTMVTHPPHVIETGIEKLESLETLAGRIGLQVEMGELEIEEREATDLEIERFALENGARVVDVSRVISTEERPIAYLVDSLPEHYLPEQVQQRRFKGSILDLLVRKQKPSVNTSLTEITAVSASAEVARELGIQRGDVLLCMEAWLRTREGDLIDHSFSYFLPGTFRFSIVRRVQGV
ncbi:MAG: GntR family transcriptional regulator [Anaerolineales bacterium]|nr:GntR family transcriptional regulator [Anaerolineales bacterium]